MTFQILGHTADLRLKVTAKTLQQLFADTLMGMMSVVKGSVRVGSKNIREISLTAVDPTALLIDFLNEALSQSQIHKEVYTDVTFENFSETKLQAKLSGVSVRQFNEDIKAVTYHEAKIEQKNGRLEVTLIFDI